MSLRKFMHKRNIYREEPNFKQLAILYPEFKKIAVTDVAGKVKINFKDEESLKVLTKTLLKHNFQLDVDIPSKKLVPALSLRLNYILWIEDLLRHSGIEMASVSGIDIGTGAICIYPLLMCKMFSCKMTCTDIDEESFKAAEKNVQQNNLQDLIRVVLVHKESILEEILKEDSSYSFVMCNPPFFETDKGLGKKSKVEPPRNAPTGNSTELEVEGGEREFIVRLMDESLQHKNKVKIYTTMFGQKSSLSFLRKELSSRGISNTIWTEFCQGYTKRWGIAWTFALKEDLDLTTAPYIRTRTEVLKARDKSLEIIFPFCKNLNSVDDVAVLLQQYLTELKIEIKPIDVSDEYLPCFACQLTAYENTWTHSRRKRRLAMRLNEAKKSNLDESQELLNNDSQLNETTKIHTGEPLLVCDLLIDEILNESEDEDSQNSSDDEDKKAIRVGLLFKEGSGGKMSMETLRQYLINKLNVRDIALIRKSASNSNKKRKRKK